MIPAATWWNTKEAMESESGEEYARLRDRITRYDAPFGYRRVFEAKRKVRAARKKRKAERLKSEKLMRLWENNP